MSRLMTGSLRLSSSARGEECHGAGEIAKWCLHVRLGGEGLHRGHRRVRHPLRRLLTLRGLLSSAAARPGDAGKVCWIRGSIGEKREWCGIRVGAISSRPSGPTSDHDRPKHDPQGVHDEGSLNSLLFPATPHPENKPIDNRPEHSHREDQFQLILHLQRHVPEGRRQDDQERKGTYDDPDGNPSFSLGCTTRCG